MPYAHTPLPLAITNPFSVFHFSPIKVMKWQFSRILCKYTNQSRHLPQRSTNRLKIFINFDQHRVLANLQLVRAMTFVVPRFGCSHSPPICGIVTTWCCFKAFLMHIIFPKIHHVRIVPTWLCKLKHLVSSINKQNKNVVNNYLKNTHNLVVNKVHNLPLEIY